MTDDLLTTFRCEVPLPDEKTARWIYDRATNSPPRMMTTRQLAAAAVMLACAAAAFGISTLVQGGGRSGPTVPGGVEPGITTLGVNPFGAQGKLITLRQFVADMADRGYDVPLPDSPLANSQNVGSIWEAPSGEVVVYYPSSGIELNYGGSGVDYRGIPRDQIKTIDGVRALVFPPNGPYIFAAVLLPIPSGHLVALLGPGPVSDLVNVARTMPINR